MTDDPPGANMRGSVPASIDTRDAIDPRCPIPERLRRLFATTPRLPAGAAGAVALRAALPSPVTSVVADALLAIGCLLYAGRTAVHAFLQPYLRHLGLLGCLVVETALTATWGVLLFYGRYLPSAALTVSLLLLTGLLSLEASLTGEVLRRHDVELGSVRLRRLPVLGVPLGQTMNSDSPLWPLRLAGFMNDSPDGRTSRFVTLLVGGLTVGAILVAGTATPAPAPVPGPTAAPTSTLTSTPAPLSTSSPMSVLSLAPTGSPSPRATLS